MGMRSGASRGLLLALLLAGFGSSVALADENTNYTWDNHPFRGPASKPEQKDKPPATTAPRRDDRHEQRGDARDRDRDRDGGHPVYRSRPDDGRQAYGDRGRDRNRDADRSTRRDDNERRDGGWDRHWRDDRHRGDDRRWEHHRPPRQVVVTALPGGYREIRHYRQSYFFADGFWYEPWGSGYMQIGAPVGVVISSLPPGYASISVGGLPYYRYAETWYRPVDRGYVVAEPPPGYVMAPSTAADDDEDTLYAYPRKGQSEQQQADDRYACHTWASDQTGYDPSLTSPAGSSRESLARRPDYLRAMSACLEGRGYTVR